MLVGPTLPNPVDKHTHTPPPGGCALGQCTNTLTPPGERTRGGSYAPLRSRFQVAAGSASFKSLPSPRRVSALGASLLFFSALASGLQLAFPHPAG
jgi:hypothetical protein